MLTAHYFKQGKNHQLVISTNARPVGTTHKVENKKAAKQLAKELNAQPWNF